MYIYICIYLFIYLFIYMCIYIYLSIFILTYIYIFDLYTIYEDIYIYMYRYIRIIRGFRKSPKGAYWGGHSLFRSMMMRGWWLCHGRETQEAKAQFKARPAGLPPESHQIHNSQCPL